jgi:hypothetical protein
MKKSFEFYSSVYTGPDLFEDDDAVSFGLFALEDTPPSSAYWPSSAEYSLQVSRSSTLDALPQQVDSNGYHSGLSPAAPDPSEQHRQGACNPCTRIHQRDACPFGSQGSCDMLRDKPRARPSKKRRQQARKMVADFVQAAGHGKECGNLAVVYEMQKQSGRGTYVRSLMEGVGMVPL